MSNAALRSLSLALLAALLTGCQTPPPTSPEAVGEVRKGSGFLNGYLDRKQLPDSLALLPQPPAPGSAQASVDMETFQRTRALRDTPRWALDKDGSYPSGHASAGWAWALVLVQAAQQRMDALLRRGHACGVHWQSDVEAGRVVGAATVARLQSDPTFAAQVALARDEVTQAQAKGLKPGGDCAAQAAALAMR